MQQTISSLAEKLGTALKQKNKKLATAESCTGGGAAFWVTSIAGSSEWFDRGFVTYSNAAKEDLLGVQPITLETFGAVSEQTAREMAEGALRFSQAEISLAITGIAGPSGGSVDKPVGMVWIACAALEQKTITKLFQFSGNRIEIREQAIICSLEMILDFIR